MSSVCVCVCVCVCMCVCVYAIREGGGLHETKKCLTVLLVGTSGGTPESPCPGIAFPE